MIEIQRHAHYEFFPKITYFADFYFLKFKIDLELNFSKIEFADFVLILKFDGFSSKTCKIQENTNNTKHQTITKLRD
jgi:hypothetical protein